MRRLPILVLLLIAGISLERLAQRITNDVVYSPLAILSGGLILTAMISMTIYLGSRLYSKKQR